MTDIRERVEKLLGYGVDPTMKPTFAGRALSDKQARSIAFEIAEDFKMRAATKEKTISYRNFSGECHSCLSGQNCERAYVSTDGTPYWCNRVLHEENKK